MQSRIDEIYVGDVGDVDVGNVDEGFELDVE